MAYMIQTGPDTFKFVSDEEEARQRAYMERDAQPRPAGLAPVRDGPETPVTALKRRTAVAQGYTPEATQLLYDTPTEMRIQPAERMFERGDPQGQYRFSPAPGQAKMMTYHYPQPANTGAQFQDQGRNVLAHEFGHLWDYEKLPPGRQQEWDKVWPSVVYANQPEYKDKAYGQMAQGADMMPREWYANQQMFGADHINPNTNKPALTPAQQDYWYPGLFRPEPKPVPPTPDVLRPHYAAPAWVPDEEGYLGYAPSRRYG